MTDPSAPVPPPVAAVPRHFDPQGWMKGLAGVAASLGAVVSVGVGVNTYLSGRTQVQVASQQRCIELSTAYMAMIRTANGEDSAGLPPSVQDANYRFLLFNHDLRQAVCTNAGFAEDLGLPSPEQLAQIAAPPPDQPVVAPGSVMAGAGAVAPVGAEAPAHRPAAGASGSPLRVFVQIHDAAQRDAARALVERLQTMQVAGHAIVVPGIQLVASATQNSVRCLKAADCVLNEALAAAISAQLVGANLDTMNLSGRYETAPNVRAGTYELWFGPGAIVLAPG